MLESGIYVRDSSLRKEDLTRNKDTTMSRRLWKKCLLGLMLVSSGIALYALYSSNQNANINANWKALINNMKIDEFPGKNVGLLDELVEITPVKPVIHADHFAEQGRFQKGPEPRKRPNYKRRPGNAPRYYHDTDNDPSYYQDEERLHRDRDEYENYKIKEQYESDNRAGFRNKQIDNNYIEDNVAERNENDAAGQNENDAAGQNENNAADENYKDAAVEIENAAAKNKEDVINNAQDVVQENGNEDRKEIVPKQIHPPHFADVPEEFVVRNEKGEILEEKLFDGGINHHIHKLMKQQQGIGGDENREAMQRGKKAWPRPENEERGAERRPERKDIHANQQNDNKIIDLNVDLNSKLSKNEDDLLANRDRIETMNEKEIDNPQLARQQQKGLPNRAIGLDLVLENKGGNVNGNNLEAFGLHDEETNKRQDNEFIRPFGQDILKPNIGVPPDRMDHKPGDNLEAFGIEGGAKVEANAQVKPNMKGNSDLSNKEEYVPYLLRNGLVKQMNDSKINMANMDKALDSINLENNAEIKETYIPYLQRHGYLPVEEVKNLDADNNNQHKDLSNQGRQLETKADENQNPQIRAQKIKEALLKLPPEFLAAFIQKQQQLHGQGLPQQQQEQQQIAQDPVTLPQQQQEQQQIAQDPVTLPQQQQEQQQIAQDPVALAHQHQPQSTVALDENQNADALQLQQPEKILLEDMQAPLPVKANCVPFQFLSRSAPLCIHQSDKDTEVSARIELEGSYEKEILDQFYEILVQEATIGVVDIGAGIGVYTLAAALLNHDVVAVEPLYRNCRLLRKSAQENMVTGKITLVTEGLDSESYVGQMNYSNNGGYSQVTIVKLTPDMKQDPANIVHMTTLDNLLQVVPFQRAVMKLDVSGAMEERILKSGHKFFSTVTVPYIITHWSVSTQPTQYWSMARELTELGYQPRLAWNGAAVNNEFLQSDHSFFVWTKNS
ncbi:myb-like protein I [Biomphalaria glabrata]|nr:myb-like protein I [Biomphalaria glabrata]